MSSPIRLIPASSSLIRRLQEELTVHLPEVERQLLSLLGFSDFLTCLTVVRHERAVGRIVLAQRKVEPLRELLQRLGLQVLRSRMDFLHKTNLVEGTNHEGAFVPRGTPGASHGVVYFGAEEELVQGAEVVDLQLDHEMLARLLGYPDCCIRFFASERTRRFDRTPDSLPDLGPFPREMNPFLPTLYGLGLLFHFPCSPRCEASRALLRQRLDYLAPLAPTTSRELESLGAGIALYGPEVGTVLVTGFRRLADDTYEVEEVVTRGERANALFSARQAPSRLRLDSVHAFELDGTRFEGEHTAAARFE